MFPTYDFFPINYLLLHWYTYTHVVAQPPWWMEHYLCRHIWKWYQNSIQVWNNITWQKSFKQIYCILSIFSFLLNLFLPITTFSELTLFKLDIVSVLLKNYCLKNQSIYPKLAMNDRKITGVIRYLLHPLYRTWKGWAILIFRPLKGRSLLKELLSKIDDHQIKSYQCHILL